MVKTRRFPTSLIATVLLAGAALSYVQVSHAQQVLQPATPQTAQQVAAASYGKWQASFDAFAASDRERQPAQNGTLFVGSSTIRMWSSLSQDFRQLPVVINRGFGGSTMADCNKYVRELVIRYQPSQVLVYAGDNDLAEGRTPQQVLESFTQFVHAVRTELPGARIDYISIKPSPSRASLLAQIREANALIGGYVATLHNAGYIDIHTPMMAADGQPRGELFLGDRLHLNNEGYRLWQSVISARLTGVTGAPVQAQALPAATAAAITAATPSTATTTSMAPTAIVQVKVMPPAAKAAQAAQATPVALTTPAVALPQLAKLP